MAKSSRSAASPHVVIDHVEPTAYDPMPPWPFTLPKERKHGFGLKRGKAVRVLVIPGAVEYDPAMHLVEETFVRVRDKGYDITIVVPDSYRGIGEIMSRRNGLDLLVISTASPSDVSLPSTQNRTHLRSSKVCKWILSKVDRVIYVVGNPFAETLVQLAEESDLPTKKFEPLYVKRKEQRASDLKSVKTKKNKRH